MLLLTTKKSKPSPCCSGCAKGTGCADKRRKPRPKYIQQPSGLLLPDRQLLQPPKTMLWPEHERLHMPRWDQPDLATFDMTCTGCCTTQSCCPEKVCPDDWPTTLTGTISGACCAGLNQTFTLNLLTCSPRVEYNAGTLDDCDPTSAPQSLTVICTNTSFWVIQGVCIALQSFIRVVSCTPLHLHGTIDFADILPPHCCAGTGVFDAVE